MKKLLLLFPLLLIFSLSAIAAEKDREFSRKTMSAKVDSIEIANALADTKNLDLNSWLNVVGNDKWSLLHASQSEFIYCAVFRDKHHVIVWFADRKDYIGQESYGVYSNDFRNPDRGNRIAKIGPSKYAVVERKINYPTGGLKVLDNATVFEIDHALDGWIQVQIGGKDSAGKLRKLLYLELPWPKDV